MRAACGGCAEAQDLVERLSCGETILVSPRMQFRIIGKPILKFNYLNSYKSYIKYKKLAVTLPFKNK